MTGKTALFAWVACACLAWGCGGVAPESPREGLGASSAGARADSAVWRCVGGPRGGFWTGVVGESLSHLLDPAGIGPGRIATLAANSRATYDVRNMKAGQRWWLASETVQDSTSTRQVPKWFVYERNPKDYALFSLQDTLGVRLGSHPVDTVYARAKEPSKRPCIKDLESLGHSTTLAVSMANVYAWTVDFSRVQKGDTYDVLYCREIVNGQPASMPIVLASTFTHWGIEHDAYRFNQGGGTSYFDVEGGSLQRVFLKAPVEFSRISSRYNPKRFHPVLKKVKGHFGTDYAAPTGTPIVAVGDGGHQRLHLGEREIREDSAQRNLRNPIPAHVEARRQEGPASASRGGDWLRGIDRVGHGAARVFPLLEKRTANRPLARGISTF